MHTIRTHTLSPAHKTIHTLAHIYFIHHFPSLVYKIWDTFYVINTVIDSLVGTLITGYRYHSTVAWLASVTGTVVVLQLQ